MNNAKILSASQIRDDAMQGLPEAIAIEAGDDAIKRLELERDEVRGLVKRLSSVPDFYIGFVLGITTYAKKKPERMAKVMEYMEQNPNASTSDIVGFVMLQEDFHEDGVSKGSFS